MVNTVKDATLIAGNNTTVVYSTILCVGAAQETNKVVYDSSAVATTLKITDPLTSTLLGIKYSTNSALGVIKLNWDASTPVAAWALPYQSNEGDFCFRKLGGLKNQGGTGITGDITLTTTGLAAGDVVSIVLEVRPN